MCKKFNSKNRELQASFSACLHVSTFMSCSFILLLMFLSTDVFASNNSSDDFCKNYDWAKVEELVEPYLDETSFTALVMQGLSSEYNTSIAAHQALEPQLPEDIYKILSRIVELNCP